MSNHVPFRPGSGTLFLKILGGFGVGSGGWAWLSHVNVSRVGELRSFTHSVRPSVSGLPSPPVTSSHPGQHWSWPRGNKGDSFSLLCLHMSFYHRRFSNVTVTSQITLRINHPNVNTIAAWGDKYCEDEIFPNEAGGKSLLK